MNTISIKYHIYVIKVMRSDYVKKLIQIVIFFFPSASERIKCLGVS